MINRLAQLQNIGQFDNVATNHQLQPISLIYAENGRGKTTLSAVFRSLANNDPLAILERHRLGAAHPPLVRIECTGGPPGNATFSNGAWDRNLTHMAVFDDAFVDANVYSGLTVGAGHRQNLHELIIGAQGVALNQQLQGIVAQIEVHNTSIRARAADLPVARMGGLAPEAFCALPENQNVDAEIQEKERAIAAVREQAPIRDTSLFERIRLPEFDLVGIERILQLDLPGLDAAAVARVQSHLAGLVPGSEAWISDGMRRLGPADDGAHCPFCAQDLAGSPVLAHYRAFFSDEYRALLQSVSSITATVDQAHAGGAHAAFERSVRVAVERRQFWARFAEMPEVSLDTAAISQDWQHARDAVAALLARKQAAPLDRLELTDEVRVAVAAYDARRTAVDQLNERLEEANGTVQLVKEQAAGANVAALTADITRLNATKARHEPAVANLCVAYRDAVAAKAATERQRQQVRQNLDQYRQTVFPNYEAAINGYLGRFNAGFRIQQIQANNTRGGPTCTYSVLINNQPVSISGEPAAGQPSFRNTLSAGDRNTLALAFFFASIERDPALASFVVVLDDPVSSLDHNRTLATIHEIRRLSQQVAQIIVLSHSKTFLVQAWPNLDRARRCALQVVRNGASSAVDAWNVDADSVTEHDRRHELLRGYLRAGGQNARDVAIAIRPTIEAFCRVAFPENFRPGDLLGPFRDRCDQRVGGPDQILSRADTDELRDLVDYGNRFHHDTNPGAHTVVINDGELTGFVRRTLDFCSR